MTPDRPNPIYIPIDKPDRAHAGDLARRKRNAVGGVKSGLESFNANDPEGFRERAAEEAFRLGVRRPRVIAVTVRTSLDDADREAVGQTGPTDAQDLRLARLARDSRLDGVVCPPREVAAIRAACDRELTPVVPGIRPAGAAKVARKRTMTTAEPLAADTEPLVIERPITEAADPATVARRIAATRRPL